MYFVTQNPCDIPDSVLAQLGNRVQHALRAFTPKEQKNVKAAAETFRANPEFNTEDAIMQLETGEALVSFLDEKGTPAMVERAKILFPLSQIGAITDAQREQIIKSSRIFGRYDKMIDRESAFELLLAESEQLSQKAEEEKAQKQAEKEQAKAEKAEKKGSNKKGILSKVLSAVISALATLLGTQLANSVTGKKSKQSLGKAAAGKAVSTATRTATRELTRSILGNLIK